MPLNSCTSKQSLNDQDIGNVQRSIPRMYNQLQNHESPGNKQTFMIMIFNRKQEKTGMSHTFSTLTYRKLCKYTTQSTFINVYERIITHLYEISRSKSVTSMSCSRFKNFGLVPCADIYRYLCT